MVKIGHIMPYFLPIGQKNVMGMSRFRPNLSPSGSSQNLHMNPKDNGISHFPSQRGYLNFSASLSCCFSLQGDFSNPHMLRIVSRLSNNFCFFKHIYSLHMSHFYKKKKFPINYPSRVMSLTYK